jgi:hypothetical protein
VTVPDRKGRDFPHNKAAREHAAGNIKAILAGKAGQVLNPAECIVEITDGRREPLFQNAL